MNRSTAINQQLTSSEKRSFYTLQCWRLLLTILAIGGITRAVDIGTNSLIIILAGCFGTALAGRNLLHRKSFTHILFVHLAFFLALYLTQQVLGYLLISSNNSPTNDFLIYRYAEIIFITLFFYLTCFLSTWFFWTNRYATTIEALFCSSLFIWLLSGHRNYHIDAPKTVSSLAFSNNFEPQNFLLLLGVLFALALGYYLVIANNRPLFKQNKQIRSYGKTNKLFAMTTSFFILALLFGYATYLQKTYAADLSRAANGVGENSNEGESSLGFNSAVGKTKTPAALLRLEGDYTDNPFKPMLYLREGALSEFNGREFVLATANYDTDVPRISPGQPFISLESGQVAPAGRKKITQSVYLLTKHKSPFAIDFPYSIRLLKNPDPSRFQLAYQALSYAPTAKLDQLIGEEVGDSSWDEKTLAHYLRAPGSLSNSPADPAVADSDDPVLDSNGEDLRYKTLSEKLTHTESTPIMKAYSIVKYLSETAIYTRSPGYTVTKKGDPVAPFLFAKEKRGYCVHFAHAAVYLMRLAGIPARIGTGYLTDLSYAKDGHLLLQMGDRHAWPEIYVHNLGWIVMDVTPQKAENEEPLIPDEKLLEELMSKINPIEEFLDKTPALPNTDQGKTMLDQVVTSSNLALLLLLIFCSLIIAKLWLRQGYKIVSNKKLKLRLAYASFASLLADLGVLRNYGETRFEFAQRLKNSLALQAEPITHYYELAVYSNTPQNISTKELKQSLAEFTISYDQSKSRWKRILAFLSPTSLTQWFKW